MTEAPGGEAAVVETTPQAAPEAAVSSQERDFDAEARQQGWVPEDEFKGDKKPKKFLSAEEFVERGEWANSIKDKVEAKFEDRLKKMERVNSKTIEQLQRQHEQDLANLTAQRREAIKEGDVERVEKLDEKIDGLKDAAPEKEAPKATKSNPEQGTPEHSALVKDFATQNSWFTEEPEMNDYARWFSGQNADLHTDISFEDNMKATVAAVQKKFPNYFKDHPAANAHAAVDSGGQFGGGPTRSARTIDSLPNEARQQAKADMAKFPKIYPTVESWVKAYNG